MELGLLASSCTGWRPPDGCRGMAPADATAAGKLTGKLHRRTPDGSARASSCVSWPAPWDAESPKKASRKGEPLGEVKMEKNGEKKR